MTHPPLYEYDPSISVPRMYPYSTGSGAPAPTAAARPQRRTSSSNSVPAYGLLVGAVGDDVVDLEDQLHHLRGQQHLLLLPDQRLEHPLMRGPFE